MRNGITRIISTLLLLSFSTPIWAQTDASGSNIWLLGLVIVVVLVVLIVVMQVADNLLMIEAKQTGANKSGANFSIFPQWSEIVRPKKPDTVVDEGVTVLRKGYDIKLEGAADCLIKDDVHVTRYALCPPNWRGIKPIPKVLVEVGAEVKAGDPLFFDKESPDIKYVAPVSGEVVEINRGAKRSIAEIVILADKEQKHTSLPAFDIENSDREALVNHLMATGGWALIRQRPFDVVADPNVTPRDIFVSTFDTAPLAPDLNFVVEGREAAFQKGIDVLAKLTTGSVHLGLNAKKDNPSSDAFANAENAEKHWFVGKHPAGNVGVQIHHVAPIAPNDTVWTLGVQEVITLGNIFLENRYDATRMVALTGHEVEDTKYVRTYVGANLSELLKGNLKSENVRIVSGDVLSGEAKTAAQYLGFYDDQVTVLSEGDDYEMFGWLLPLKPRPSVSRTFPNFIFPEMKFKPDTNTHGERRAFVVTGQYEQVLPMDIYPQHLMKSIIVNDYERMEGLGIHELIEEDIALCEFVCTSKQPLQEILRQGLDMVREQS